MARTPAADDFETIRARIPAERQQTPTPKNNSVRW